MNLQQKIQLGFGGLITLGGIAALFFNPPVGMFLVPTGLGVMGFSNTVTSAIKNVFGSGSGVKVDPNATKQVEVKS